MCGLNKVKTISVMLFGLTVAACGGGGGGSSSGPATGFLIDSPIDGVFYSTATHSGYTGSDGAFTYTKGEVVTFSIGGIALGTVSAKETISPIDLSTTETVVDNARLINMLRFIQSLDEDETPSNGIRISSTASSLAEGVSIDFSQSIVEFESDTDVNLYLSNATTQNLVSVTSAISHFESSDTTYGLTLGSGFDMPRLEEEPNTEFSDRQQLSIPAIIYGTVNSETDRGDYFTFTAESDGVLSITLSEYDPSYSLLLTLVWTPPEGVADGNIDNYIIEENSLLGGPPQSKKVNVLENATYTVGAHGLLTGGADSHYLLSFSLASAEETNGQIVATGADFVGRWKLIDNDGEVTYLDVPTSGFSTWYYVYGSYCEIDTGPDSGLLSEVYNYFEVSSGADYIEIKDTSAPDFFGQSTEYYETSDSLPVGCASIDDEL